MGNLERRSRNHKRGSEGQPRRSVEVISASPKGDLVKGNAASTRLKQMHKTILHEASMDNLPRPRERLKHPGEPGPPRQPTK